MAFSDYRQYNLSDLLKFFQIDVTNTKDLFDGFTPTGQTYDELQEEITELSWRLRMSKSDNEATRGSLLVSRVLAKAGVVYKLGIFLEPPVTFRPEEPHNLPHPLSGAFDGAVTLDKIDFISPIISVVEVKRGSLSDGFGQCIAEMYATLHMFQQENVYGIVTDGETWEFLFLDTSIVAVHIHTYSINAVADIVDRIGYIANSFKK